MVGYSLKLSLFIREQRGWRGQSGLVLPEPCPLWHSGKNTSAKVLVSQIPGPLIGLHIGGHGAER